MKNKNNPELNKAASKKAVLQEAQDWCDDEDKSTEFMIQYMADSLVAAFPDEEEFAFDTVMEFITRG